MPKMIRSSEPVADPFHGSKDVDVAYCEICGATAGTNYVGCECPECEAEAELVAKYIPTNVWDEEELKECNKELDY